MWSKNIIILAILSLSACGQSEGTISVDVIASPRSDLLQRIETLRVTLSTPNKQIEAKRNADGIKISFDVDVQSEPGALILEGINDQNELIALGFSPEIPLAAIDATLSVFMAPPMSMSEATATLPTGRVHMGSTRVLSNHILAGGRGDQNNLMDDIFLYSGITHTLSTLTPLPDPAENIAIVPGFRLAAAYMFGGQLEDGDSGKSYSLEFSGQAEGRLSVLDTSALSGPISSAATIGTELYVTGSNPSYLFDGFTRDFTEATPTTVLANTISQNVFSPDGSPAALFVNADQTHRVDRETIVTLSSSPSERMQDGQLTSLPDGNAIWMGGLINGSPTTSGVRYAHSSSRFETIENILSEARTSPALAFSGRYLIVAGGFDENDIPSRVVDVIDATSLTRVTTLSMIHARANAVAMAMQNGQILIAGGIDDDGEFPIEMEFFTPDLEQTP